jgi:hypothetical protein
MSRVAIILAILVPIPALLSAQFSGDTAPALEGCYRLAVGDWEPALQIVDAHYHTPPAFFLLTDVPSDDARIEASMAYPVIPHSTRSRAWWEELGGDSVRIAWSDGFTGVQLHLRAEGDSLVGTAQATSDLKHVVLTTDASGDTIQQVVPSPATNAVARPDTCPEWLQRLAEPEPRP